LTLTYMSVSSEESTVDLKPEAKGEQEDAAPEEVIEPPLQLFHPLNWEILALLMPASVFGVLARLGLGALASYAGESIFPLAYAQGVGCLIMGFCLALKGPISKCYPPLYIALATGFCGSLTTFSGWQYDVFGSWTNSSNAGRNWLRDVVDGITKLVFTLIISMSSVSFGSYLAQISRSYLPRVPMPRPAIRYTLSAVGVLIYAATFPAYATLPPSYRSQAVASLLFSFPGTLSRYLLALSMNMAMKKIPLGTMAANILGTGLLGVFHVLQNKHQHVSLHACSTLQGLIDGYCGALTTVSTFAVELNAMGGSRYAWIYGGISIVISQLLLAVVILPAHTLSGVPFIRSCTYEQ